MTKTKSSNDEFRNESKYEVTYETKVIMIPSIAPDKPERNVTVHQIRALRNFFNVKAGELGGWVESTKNLSWCDSAWIYDNAVACDDAYVRGTGYLSGNAIACDKSRVASGFVVNNAIVADDALILGGHICDKAIVAGSATVEEGVTIADNAKLIGDGQFSGSRLYISGGTWNQQPLLIREGKILMFMRSDKLLYINGMVHTLKQWKRYGPDLMYKSDIDKLISNDCKFTDGDLETIKYYLNIFFDRYLNK